MSDALKSMQSAVRVAGVSCIARCFLAFVVIGPASSGFARDVTPTEPMFNEAAAREFPQAIYDRIAAKITAQTTFQQFSTDEVVRWWPRTIKLVEFVKAPSPTYPGAYLYAMRYAVSVLSERESFAVYETSCQVVVVQRNDRYSEPTVVCAPVNLNQEGDAS
jgi:hypothetical protein